MHSEYCFVVSIKANPSWLELDRTSRDQHWKKARQVIAEYADRVSFTYFDADAFRSDMSDMIVCNTEDPVEYHHLWDRLKDTQLFCQGHYTITDVRFGIKGVSHG